jgi:hypothetical protein
MRDRVYETSAASFSRNDTINPRGVTAKNAQWLETVDNRAPGATRSNQPRRIRWSLPQFPGGTTGYRYTVFPAKMML